MTEIISKIPARIKNAAVGGHVCGTEDIIDDVKNKTQQQINSEVEESLGTGGSVDERIAAAKTEIIGDAASDYNTLGKLEDKVQAETTRAETAEGALDGRVDTLENAVGTGGSVDSRISTAVATETSRAQTAEQLLQEQYNALTQSDIVIGVLPASGTKNLIYRVPGTNSYSDYMWNGTQFVKMAEYDNAIDNEPTAGSDNLAKSGGIYESILSAKGSVIESKNINKTKDLAVESGGQSVIIPMALVKGVKYNIILVSDTDNSSYIDVKLGDSFGTSVIPRIWDNINNNPKGGDFVSDVDVPYFYVYIRGISTAGHITVTLQYDLEVIEKSYLEPKCGKNLCDISSRPSGKLSVDSLGIIDYGETVRNLTVTPFIPIKAGQTLVCNKTAFASGYNICALFPNNVERACIDGTAVTSQIEQGYQVITNNLGYDAFAVFSIDDRYLDDVQVEVGFVPTKYEPYNPIAGYFTEENYDSYGKIGAYYPSEVEKVVKGINENVVGTKLHFCHISDNHGGSFGYANEFTDLSPAKFLVDTGDLVADKFSDSFDTPKGRILAMNKPGYVVLGNHDVYQSTSLQARFEKYFAPLNEHNGLTSNTKTYYSVDYSQEKVKCIFLDMNDGWDDTSGLNMSYFINNSKMSSEQINWFAQELISAKTNNLHVACFIHVSPDDVNYEKSPIDFYDYQVDKATNVSFLCDMVDKFIEGGTVTFTHNDQEYTFTFASGGHFVGWLCGHMHCDTSGWMLNHPKQFSISVPRPGWNSMKEDGTYRIPKLGITFNYVTIDTVFKRLSILRMGNNKTIWGTPREGFSIRYN